MKRVTDKLRIVTKRIFSLIGILFTPFERSQRQYGGINLHLFLI